MRKLDRLGEKVNDYHQIQGEEKYLQNNGSES
jgi:hypothetical protein